MTPENGKFTLISHATLSTSNFTVPIETTHIVFASATTSDEYGILGFKPNGSTLQKLVLPTGTFIRLGNVTNGTSTLVTDATAPATTITSATFYKWEKE